jgi:hypothetical protein
MNQNTMSALDVIFDVKPEPKSTQLQLGFDNDSEVTVITPSELIPEPDTQLIAAEHEPTIEEREAKEDYSLSRTALTVVAMDAQTTLHRAVEVAQQTDTPRAFEAVADMVRATIEVHREIQQLHKTAAEIRAANKPAGASQGNVNVAKGVIFNGGADELLRMIAKDRK